MCACALVQDGRSPKPIIPPGGSIDSTPLLLSPRPGPDGQQGGEQEEGHGGCAGYFRPVGEEGFRCCPLPTPKVGVFWQPRYLASYTPPPHPLWPQEGCCCSHPVFPKIVPRVLSLTTTSRKQNRYQLVRAKLGPAYDNLAMDSAVLLDASVGPPYDVPVPTPAAQGEKSTTGAGQQQQQPPPPPPNTGIVASCTSKLFLGPEWGNYNGVMHGGAAGVIFDMLTTIALGPVARPGFWTCVLFPPPA